METPTPGPAEQKPDMLNDVLDTREYDGKVKSAQTAIFVVAGVQLIFGIILAFVGAEADRNIQIIFSVIIAAIFGGLGLWCKKMPLIAIIIALCLYVGIQILGAVVDPSTLYKGIIMKALIIFYLIKGIGAAKAAQDIKNMGK